jgi:hypothetical protein
VTLMTNRTPEMSVYTRGPMYHRSPVLGSMPCEGGGQAGDLAKVVDQVRLLAGTFLSFLPETDVAAVYRRADRL